MTKSLIRRVGKIFLNPPSPLLEIIRQAIRESGPITLEEYMGLVLQHPQFGYYRQGNPIGNKGDFSTAPEVSQMFGEMVGLWCFRRWENMGRPKSFVLLELGPGRGTMLQDMLRFTTSHPDFQQAIKIRLLESNQTLRDIQIEKLQNYHPIHIDNLSQLEDLPLIVIANEFFDNIPLRQFKKISGKWFERVVGLQKGGDLVIVERETPQSSFDDLGLAAQVNMPENSFCEVSKISQKIVGQLSAHIALYGGAALLVDYGYGDRKGDNSLIGWKGQRQVDILETPGFVDVTADVDFAALGNVALKHGVSVTGPIAQGEFLRQCGIEERAKFLCSILSESQIGQINSAMDMLLSPYRMGELWKIMILDMLG